MTSSRSAFNISLNSVPHTCKAAPYRLHCLLTGTIYIYLTITITNPHSPTDVEKEVTSLEKWKTPPNSYTSALEPASGPALFLRVPRSMEQIAKVRAGQGPQAKGLIRGTKKGRV